jgi:uncharacterized protein with PIN domain
MNNYIFASLALFLTIASSTIVQPNNILDYNPEERPEIAIQTICSAYPELKSCQQIEPMEKRKSAYMRFGKRSLASSSFDGGDEMPLVGGSMEKRKSAYMRFGKRSSSDDSEIEMNKRKSAYMRFGKRSSPSDAAVSEMETQDVNKRKSAYMRFGKRAFEESAMNEMPMSEIQQQQPMMKRKSAYMRFGKRAAENFEDSMINGQEVAKRKSAYMRFGR